MTDPPPVHSTSPANGADPVGRLEHAARAGETPRQAVLATIAGRFDEDVLEAALDRFDVLAEEGDGAVLRRFADLLGRIADRLVDPLDRAIRAKVDLVVAVRCCDEEKWAEAVERAERAGPDLADLFPWMLARREEVLAVAAGHQGRDADAYRHWCTARDRYAETEEWGAAAHAASAGAFRHPELSTDALADWRRAVALHDLAGDPDLADEFLWEVWPLVAARAAGLGLDDQDGVRELGALVEDVRTVAAERDIPLMVALAGVALVQIAANAGEEHAPLASRIALCRAELEPFANDPGLQPVFAWLDVFEAVAMLTAGRLFPDVEAVLARAHRVLRAAGDVDGTLACEQTLAFLLIATMSPGEFTPPPGSEDWTDPEVRALLTALHGVRLRQDGARTQAHAALLAAREQTARTATPLGGYVDMIVAVTLLADGELAAAEADRVLRRLDAATSGPLAAHWWVRLLTVAAGGILRSVHARITGDEHGVRQHLARMEQDMLDLGVGMGAAFAGSARAAARPAEDDAQDVLREGVPALLALEALRSRLPDADRRRQYGVTLEHGSSAMLRRAAVAGEIRLLAELLEVRRGRPIPEPLPADARDDAVSALALMLQPSPTGEGAALVPTGPKQAGGGEERTVLGPSARIRTPWGTVALQEHLDRARRYLDPVAADTIVAWRVDDGRDG